MNLPSKKTLVLSLLTLTIFSIMIIPTVNNNVIQAQEQQQNDLALHINCQRGLNIDNNTLHITSNNTRYGPVVIISGNMKNTNQHNTTFHRVEVLGALYDQQGNTLHRNTTNGFKKTLISGESVPFKLYARTSLELVKYLHLTCNWKELELGSCSIARDNYMPGPYHKKLCK